MASITDQALFSGTQFLVNILLARWLDVADYGIYTIIYTFIIFVSALHVAFVAEPVAVFWAQHRAREKDFFRDVFGINLLFSLGMTAIGLAAAFVFYEFGFISADIFMVAPALLLTLPLLWLLRQVSYATMRPWDAVLQSLLYSIVTIACSVALWRSGMLSPTTALMANAVGALVAALLILALHRPKVKPRLDMEFRRTLDSVWRYGRWSAPSGVTNWFAANVYLLVMPLATSVSDTARVKAFLNVLLPFQQVLLGLSLVVLPKLSEILTDGRRLQAARLTRWLFLAAILGSLMFSAILLLVGEPIYRLVYGARYAQDAGLIIYGIALPTLWAIIAVARTVLRAHRAPKAIFIAYAVSLLTVGLLAIPGGAMLGPQGALIGMTVIHIVIAACLIRFIRKTSTSEV